jgi:DNA-binding XRE family transcriptional regulator
MNAIPHSVVTTPAGEELVLVPRADFEAMQDRLDVLSHAETMAAIGRGEQELLNADEVRAALTSATPLAFWRGKRGYRQKEFAGLVGISPSYMSELEAGKRKGDPALFRRLAARLNVRMEDLVPDEG